MYRWWYLHVSPTPARKPDSTLSAFIRAPPDPPATQPTAADKMSHFLNVKEIADEGSVSRCRDKAVHFCYHLHTEHLFSAWLSFCREVIMVLCVSCLFAALYSMGGKDFDLTFGSTPV
jgi:hypothetical protein